MLTLALLCVDLLLIDACCVWLPHCTTVLLSHGLAPSFFPPLWHQGINNFCRTDVAEKKFEGGHLWPGSVSCCCCAVLCWLGAHLCCDA